MKKLLIIVGAVVAMVLAAPFVAPMVLPKDFVHAHLAQALQRSTRLRLEDAQSVRFVLSPKPGFVVEGVTARLPERYTQMAIVRADHVFAALDLSTVLTRRWKVSHVTISRPSIRFDENAENADSSSPSRGGKPRLAALGNTPSATPGEPASRLRRFKLPTADIDLIDGQLSIAHGAPGNRIELTNFNLHIGRAEGNKLRDARLIAHGNKLRGEGTMQLMGEEVRLRMFAAEPESPDGEATLSVDLASEVMNWSLEGKLAQADSPRFSGRARIEIPSGERLAALLGGKSQVLARLSNSSFDGHFKVAHNTFTLTDATLRGPGTDGKLEASIDLAGLVSVTLKSLSLHGGTGSGQFTFDARRRPEPGFSGSVDVSGVDMMALSTAFSDFDWLSGRADVSLRISGYGKNLAEITEALTGEGRVNVTQGALEGLDLPLIVAKASEGDFKKWRREQGMRTSFETFNASFGLDGGVASTQDLTLEGPNVSASGAGSADLGRQTLKFKMKTRITARADGEQSDQGDTVAIPLVIKGNLKRPAIRLDVGSALKDGKGLSGNIKFLSKSAEGLFRKKKKKPAEANAEPPSAEFDDEELEAEGAR